MKIIKQIKKKIVTFFEGIISLNYLDIKLKTLIIIDDKTKQF